MRASKPASLMYLGVKGMVIALDRRSGVEAWRTPLKGADFVNVMLEDDSLFATTRGEIFCVDPTTGRVRWHNPLKGLGWGIVTIAGDSMAPTAQQVHQARAAATAAAM